jgi:multidrug efflux pump subunit AcrA (membrane-fusion protein)
VAMNSEGATDAELALAQVSIESAEASAADPEDALADTAVEAPFAGTVVSVAGEVDELEPLEPDAGGGGERRRDGTSGMEGRRHCRAFRPS